jgi:CheY-like chemotaxis protein
VPGLTRDSIRILHVDDDNDFAELSALGLRKVGFSQPVTRCKDGLLALHYISALDPENGPHVILLDLHMPRMNGLEVLHWLRRNYAKAGVAIYLLTSSDNPAHKKQAEADGVTEYLIKSPYADLLVEKLDLLIAKINDEEAPTTFQTDGVAATPNEDLTSFPQAEPFSRADESSSEAMG